MVQQFIIIQKNAQGVGFGVNTESELGNSTGWGNPCGLTGKVTHRSGTGYDSPTRQLSNKPKNVPNG